MFELLRLVSELLFGSPLAFSRECFDYLFSNLHTILIQFIQQAFSIALRSKRTRLLGDDLQIIFKCHSISPLFGYSCSFRANRKALFQTVRQDGRILYTQTDLPIHFHLLNQNHQIFQTKKNSRSSSQDILLHVEWLAINGEHTSIQIQSIFFEKSLLIKEKQLYFFYLQLNNFNEEIRHFLRSDHLALNTILSNLIDWCRTNICECLLHNCRLQKRRQLVSYLTIIDCLLDNTSIAINQYLYILSPITITCLLYKYENDNLLDLNETEDDSNHIWSIRLLAGKTCVKILQRSTFLIYDVFYIRLISRLIYSLTNSSTSSSSIIYAILCLFEQLGIHVVRSFLLPYLSDIDPLKISSSKSILSVLERIAQMLVHPK